MRRRVHWPIVLGVLLATATPLGARQADANRQDREPFAWRRWAYMAIGTAIGVVPGLIGSNDAGEPTWCGSSRCDAIVSGGLSGSIGFLIGREHDRIALRRWRIGRDLGFSEQSIELAFAPQRLLAASVGGAIVVGDRGVTLVRPDLAVLPHGGELRGVTTAADLPVHRSLLVGTELGIFAFPLRESVEAGPEPLGTRVRRSATQSLLQVSSAELFVAALDSLARISVFDQGNGLVASDLAVVPASDSITAAAYSASTNTIWTLEGQVLRGRDRETLQTTGELHLPVRGRSLAVDGAIGAVGAGSGGALLLDLRRPAQPRLAARISMDAVHLEAGMAFQRGRLYIAAGQQGLVVLDVPEPDRWELLGVVRGIGSVDGVVASEDGIYILDRRARQLHRVQLKDGNRP
jgi:hypothetical protein